MPNFVFIVHKINPVHINFPFYLHECNQCPLVIRAMFSYYYSELLKNQAIRGINLISHDLELAFQQIMYHKH